MTVILKHVLAVSLLCLTGAFSAQAATPGEVRTGEVLREASMQGLLNPGRKLSAFRGQPLLINVWASWCVPCRQEMASLERLSRRSWGTELNIIGISTDDHRDRAEAFLRRSGVSFNNYIDSHLLLENMLGADRLPLTLLVDAQGRVLAKIYGAKEWDSPQALALIDKHLRIRL